MTFKKFIKKIAIATTLTVSSLNAYAGIVNVWGEMKNGNNTHINTFYDNLSGHSSTSISGQLNTNDLSGVDLLWATQPGDAYTIDELDSMATYLSGGGRIAFMGEHGSFTPDQNIRINEALSYLGAGMEIENSILDGGYRDATTAGGQILDHSLTAGVDTYNYAAFAPLVNLSGNAEALMLGADLSSVMMAFENIGAGSIFLITDQNVWDNVNNSSNDNAQMFENLLVAQTAPPVPSVSEPTTIAILSLSLIGLLSRRKKV